MSGKRARLHIVVVVGGDLHALRALDQEGRMPGVGDADLVARQRRELEGRRNGPRRLAGHHAGAVLHHFRLGGLARGDGCALRRSDGQPDQHRKRGEKPPIQDHGQSSIRPARRTGI